MSGRLLIADRVASNRILLCSRLEAARYRVAAVETLNALVAELGAAPVDLVIADLNILLPDVGASIAHLRQASSSAHLPVIVTSGPSGAPDTADILEAGGDDLQRRDIDGAVLMARVRAMLRARATFEEADERRATAAHLGFAEPPAPFAPRSRIAFVAPTGGTVPAHLPAHVRRLCPRDALDLASPETAPELVFLSLAPPDDALPLLSELRTRPATRHAAIVALVPDPQGRLTMDALDRGANDVIAMNASAREIALRTQRQLALKRAADGLRQSNDTGYQAATTDALTGLFNRRYADHRLAQIKADAGEFAVILADLDRFKDINDQFGHPAGDAVLRDFAERLRRALRSPDLLTRYGGEEFLAILPKTNAEEAAIVAERLAQVTRADPFRLPSDDILDVTASFGVAAVCAGCTSGDLIERADKALYHAKRSGRDRVVLAPSPPAAGVLAET